MTTTTHLKLNRIIALRDQANHPSTGEAEAATFIAKARELCVKYGIDQAVLTEAAKNTVKRDYIDGSQPQEKKFACRFGCSAWTMHTIDELNACAEKARNANGGNAYAKPKTDPFEDMFRGFFNAQGSRGNADYTPPRDSEPKARAHGTHAYCSHEATKSARARCRRERGF